MINLYNSPILKWERFREHLKSHHTTATMITPVIADVERVIYAAVESGAKVNVLSELEATLEEYGGRLIRKSVD